MLRFFIPKFPHPSLSNHTNIAMKRYNLALNNSYDKYVFFMFSLSDRNWVTHYHVNTSMLISSAKNSPGTWFGPILATGLLSMRQSWAAIYKKQHKTINFCSGFSMYTKHTRTHEFLTWSLGPVILWRSRHCSSPAIRFTWARGTFSRDWQFFENKYRHLALHNAHSHQTREYHCIG